MHNLLSEIVLFGELPEYSILKEIGKISENIDVNAGANDADRRSFNAQIKKLLQMAVKYGFEGDIWHSYIIFILIMDENPFTRVCEKKAAVQGSIAEFGREDIAVLKRIYNFDFSSLEGELKLHIMDRVKNFTPAEKESAMYHKNIREKVNSLKEKLDKAEDDGAFYDRITEFYRDFGFGEFGLNRAFRINPQNDESVKFLPINNMERVVLDDLIGYELQKQKLVENTKAFVSGKKANNVLLYGDSGTGKSTSIKAIVNEFYGEGLRMIEVYKHQFRYLSQLISQIKDRNYKFIIYMDDLSFEDFETEYKFLKAVIEGGVETKPDNVLIYATSNRRHLVKETWKDRDDVEMDNGLHHSDTMQEKLSLAYRFGVTINYSRPSQKEFFNIVINLARKNGITMPDDEICAEANKWELAHGGISGRTAEQFVTHLMGQ
ncbi:MAG: ATP-binding protein [Lachnospiraceae bacterium]|nr:ATP-binding protein [Lachnospiraceae bacterium]